MSDSFKRRAPDPGNSHFGAIYLLECYEIVLLCLVITLTNLQKLRKIRGHSNAQKKRRPAGPLL
jgi:hypothetical protein